MKFLLINICFVGFTQFVIAQTEKFEKAKVENKSVFNANIDKVWAYLSDLGNLQNLVPSTIKTSVTEGKGLGSTVILRLQNEGKIVEKVVKLNIKKCIICYKMIETPLPVKDYLACFKVKELKNKQVEITFIANFLVQKANRQARVENFNNLQLELLRNIKRIFQE
ncbi:hypothetical protein AD998_21790 [bacterium 336/3]|nr:hypothetical protein AD998_21790 [bacterium 336/3]